MKSVGFRQIFVTVSALVFLASATLCFGPLRAQAALRAGVLGGLAVTGSTVSSGGSPNLDSSSAQVAYKFGVEADYGVIPALMGLEVDALYARYSWLLSVIGGPQSVSYDSNWWEVPLFVNYTGLQGFKFGMGPFFDFASGHVSQSGWGSFSAGIAAQTAFDHPLSSKWALSVGLRYMMGLTNLYDDGSPNDLKLHSFDVLGGLQYLF